MSSALLFPGQGSQEPGMGRDLAEADADCMALWKKAEKISGIELRSVYWEGSEADMAETRNLQPALTGVNINLWRALSAKLRPGAACGHSLGEFSALAAAEVLPVDVVLELVSLRGRLMSQADPDGKGGMAAVLRLSLEQVDECVREARDESGEPLIVANYNTPAQFVVSGGKGAVGLIQEKVKALKGRAVPLAVSGAFHSPLMAEAAAEFAAAVNSVKSTAWSAARFPVYCNAEPGPAQDPAALKSLMIRQMTASVQWIACVRGLWDAGCRAFVECGPKGVLSRMIAPILQEYPPAAARDSDSPAWTSLGVGNRKAVEGFAPCP
jgi:[acyl-carrier-protein] S-malonyltransferase